MTKNKKPRKASTPTSPKSDESDRENPGSSGNTNPPFPLKHQLDESTSEMFSAIFREAEERGKDGLCGAPQAASAHRGDQENNVE